MSGAVRVDRRIAGVAVALAAVTSCATGEGITDGVDGGSGRDLSVDGGRAVGDSLPRGAISFFSRKSCPTGWQSYAAASGRTIVPSHGSDPVGGVVGQPLGDLEERSHGHAVSGSLELSSVDYAGIAGEANHGVGHGGAQPLKVAVTGASAALPYLQLLACQKVVEADRAQRPPPAGLLLFFATPSCPDGWLQPALSQGRFVVGLPKLGTAAQSFGGAPLSSLESRSHHHQVRGTLQTATHGIALLSGGLASGYAKDGKYSYQLDSAAAAVELPYVQLLQCQKQ